MVTRTTLVILFCFLSACGNNFESYSDGISHLDLAEEQQPDRQSDNDRQGTIPGQDPDEVTDRFLLEDFAVKQGLCPELSLSGVTWPKNLLGPKELKAYIIALNLSGSFEGDTGWSNLTNNFDGQGLSMGLLNQTLGTGSLQPLLLNARYRFPKVLSQHFDSNNGKSLQNMLDVWQREQNYIPFSTTPEVVSSLDMPFELMASSSNQTRSSNQKSVNWAVNELYMGMQFKAQWKRQLSDFLNSPEYIVIQMEAALNLHKKTIAYMERLGFNSMRAYLFFFDIVVQNGTVRSAVEQDYLNYLSQQPSFPTEQKRLEKILNLRLNYVLSRWRTDVADRKLSIINGSGRVHGSFRQYQQEYCFSLNESLDVYANSIALSTTQ